MSEPRAADQAETINCCVAAPAAGQEVVTQNQSVGTRRPLALSLAVLGSLAGALVRLVPHGWNLSPSYAAEVFAGARLRAWQAFALALGVRAVTDLIIFLFPFPGQEGTWRFYISFLPWVYLSVVLNVCLGRLVRNTETGWKIGGITFLAALQFFVITNFGTWVGSDIYPKNLGGLVACYLAALPWFRNQFISYLIFVPVLFGAYAVLSRSLLLKERVATAEAQ
jgi:hypothetical protein